MAKGRNILLLNNDVVVTTGWLGRMLHALRGGDSRIGLVGPHSNFVSGPQQIEVGYENLAELDGFAWRSGPNDYNITYSYDGVGNRMLMVNNGAPTTYAYDSANELVISQSSAGVTTYTFDRDGNLLTTLAPGNQSTTYAWDGENRLTRAALPAAIVDSFTYNGDGQRVQKQDSTGTTNHIWDRQNIILETNASNIIQVVYTAGAPCSTAT